MTSAAAKILEQASRLPAQEKLQLVDKLIADMDLPDASVDALWAEEALRRSKAVKNGDLTTKPLGEVLRKYS